MSGDSLSVYGIEQTTLETAGKQVTVPAYMFNSTTVGPGQRLRVGINVKPLYSAYGRAEVQIMDTTADAVLLSEG